MYLTLVIDNLALGNLGSKGIILPLNNKKQYGLTLKKLIQYTSKYINYTLVIFICNI